MSESVAINLTVGATVHNSIGAVYKEVISTSNAMVRKVMATSDQIAAHDAVDQYTKQLEDLKEHQRQTGDHSEEMANKIKLAEMRLEEAQKAAAGTSETQAKLSKSILETEKKLKAADSVEQYRIQLAELRKQQAETGDESGEIARQIQRAEGALNSAEDAARALGVDTENLAGEQVALRQGLNRLSGELDEYNQSLAQAERQQRQFAAEQAAMVREFDRLCDEVDEYNRSLAQAERQQGRFGRSLDRIRSGANRTMKVMGGLAKVGGVGIAAGGAAFAGLAAVNQNAAIRNSDAAAVGLSADTAQALGAMVGGIGFGTENIVDLAEELNNKFGESKGLEEMTTATKEGLDILKLDFEKLKKLSPEDQMMEIFRAAEKLDDVQEAASGIDMLMGADGNKIVTHFRNLGGGIDATLDQYKELISANEQSAEGARVFNSSMGKMKLSIGSAVEYITGLIGGEMASTIEDFAGMIPKYLKENQTEIESYIGMIVPFLKSLPTRIGDCIEKLDKFYDSMMVIADGTIALGKTFGLIDEEYEPDFVIDHDYTDEEQAQLDAMRQDREERRKRQREANGHIDEARQQSYQQTTNNQQNKFSFVVNAAPGMNEKTLAEDIVDKTTSVFESPEKSLSLFDH